MNLLQSGTDISNCEITNIEKLGFWLLVDNREYYICFEEYPVFQKAKLEEIFSLTRPTPEHIHWPELDVDVELEALEKPKNFVLRYNP